MNIFVTSAMPRKAAAEHPDVLVHKMNTEYVQILCSALVVLGIYRDDAGLYRPTHLGHPSVSWAAECAANFEWLRALQFGLNCEWVRRSEAGAWPTQPKQRRGADHSAAFVGDQAYAVFRDNINRFSRNRPMTAWPQAMPLAYRQPVSGKEPVGWHADDHPAIVAYQRYLRGAKGWLKNKPATWTGRDPPGWWHNNDGPVGDPKQIFGEDPWEA